MRSPLVALALLVATVAAVRPWSIARSTTTERCYATWPHATGIYQLDTDSPDVIQGVLEVDRLDTAGAWTVPQTGGIAIVRDEMLDATLLFGIEPAAGQIVRYTLDERTGLVSKLADRMVILSGLTAPEALAFDAAGETACVTYTSAQTGVHMARCYRISRQRSVLAHKGIDEWWTSVGQYPYSASAPDAAPAESLSSIGFDARARPMEHATRSLWIDHAWDTQRRVMTRFPLVSDGSPTPESTEIYHDGAAPANAEHIVWQFAPDTGLFSVLSEQYDPVKALPTLFATSWTADSQPRVQRLSLDPQTIGVLAHKYIAMWLAATLDSAQLIDLQLAGTASINYDRTAQATALGYASPTPSISASRPPATPSETPVPSRINTSPSRFPDLVLPVAPSSLPMPVQETIEKPAEHHKGRGRSLSALWALAFIVPVCCCVVAFLAVQKRRALMAPLVYGGTLREKMVATFSLLGKPTQPEEYDIGSFADMHLIPIARDSTQAS